MGFTVKSLPRRFRVQTRGWPQHKSDTRICFCARACTSTRCVSHPNEKHDGQNPPVCSARVRQKERQGEREGESRGRWWWRRRRYGGVGRRGGGRAQRLVAVRLGERLRRRADQGELYIKALALALALAIHIYIFLVGVGVLL